MTFKLDLTETFPNLPRAPIVEAVIHWQARAGKALQPTELQPKLSEKLPDYPACKLQHGLQIEATGGSEGALETRQRMLWEGFRLESENKQYVAQFTPHGIVFSRLAPYENWNSFHSEAMRLWRVFLELAEPPAIQRLGVRFINRMPLESGEKVSDYLRAALKPSKDMELKAKSFFHQDLYQVPGHPYRVNLVRTIQSASVPSNDAPALILDIDVFTEELASLEVQLLQDRLAEIRWLKNKMFFTCLNKRAIEQFKEPLQ